MGRKCLRIISTDSLKMSHGYVSVYRSSTIVRIIDGKRLRIHADCRNSHKNKTFVKRTREELIQLGFYVYMINALTSM